MGVCKEVLDILILIIPTPLVLALFCRSIPTSLFILKCFFILYNYTATATVHVTPHIHSTCTSYVLYAYLYCVYVLVSGAISIRDLCPRITRYLPQARCLCSDNVAIGFKPA